MLKISGILLLSILTLSCSKNEFSVNNLNGNKVAAFGHGGMGTKSNYPINSFESIMKCLNFGADGTELDVQLTKDNVLIAFHDNNLAESTTSLGLVNTLNWADIKEAHYTNPLYTNYSVISLDQLFSNIDNLHQYTYTFDCKLNYGSDDPISYNTRFTNAIEQIVNKFNLINNVFIEAQDETFLTLLKLKRNNYKLFIYPNSFNSGLEIAQRLNLYGITISTAIVSKENIETAHKSNIHVAIWSIGSKAANIEGINKNPDFIQSDKIKNLIDLVE